MPGHNLTMHDRGQGKHSDRMLRGTHSDKMHIQTKWAFRWDVRTYRLHFRAGCVTFNYMFPYITTLFSSMKPTFPYVQPLAHIPIRGAPGRVQLFQVSAVLNSQVHFSTQNPSLKGSKQTPKKHNRLFPAPRPPDRCRQCALMETRRHQ